MANDYDREINVKTMKHMIHNNNVSFRYLVFASFSRGDTKLTHVMEKFVFLLEIRRD